ncbi:MAG TPA: cytochrome c3 family protein [Candidatus Binatia bacterium]|nr:cytochrome c3 family protein [Candidatus Binatia bacterium]
MPQIFHPSTNTISKVSLFGAFLLLLVIGSVIASINRSPYVTHAEVTQEQPVQFSHKHHVGDDGIDCRYCHTSVEQSSFAGIPSTKICMNCHSQVWSGSPMLEPVRQSLATGRAIEWRRVHNLPDFVYFDHSIHVHKGVGCATCHGRVDRMPLMWQQESLLMEWCLECHRDPEPYIRPREQVFNMNWQPQENQSDLGKRLIKEYNIRGADVLTSCSTCHR